MYALTSALSGCAHHPLGSGASSGSYVFLTGNWQFVATPDSGTQPFTILSGFVNESGDDPGVNDFMTAAMQIQSSTCYSNSPNLFLSGAVTGDHVGISSFPVNDQVLTINASKDTTATHITGSYSISGGCANGATGTIAGTLYAPLDGTYLGTFTSSSGHALQLTLSQYVQGTADGLSLISGAGVLQGFSCFTNLTMPAANGFVSGDRIHFVFNTNEAPSSTATMSGTFDPTAHTISLSSVRIEGGSCSGAVGAINLTLQ